MTDPRPMSAPIRRQQQRLWSRTAFFTLFVLAPPLDIFRLDLHLGHFILFGFDWTLGLDGLQRGLITPGQAALNLLLRGFLPVAATAGLFLWVAWRCGRIYCGWFCPHFSVVETINGLMRRAAGRLTLWQREPLTAVRPDGRIERRHPAWWLVVALAVAGFALLWAVALLSYLLPPKEVYGNLLALSPTRNQAIFLGAATTVFVIEFTLARHLFCRFGCAVGLFQSYLWMANRRALVVGFDRPRAAACVDCGGACDDVCPMRLKPRLDKRHMFACTNCGRCLEACSQVQRADPRGGLLQWVSGECALDVSRQEFGARHVCSDPHCFLSNPPPRRSVQLVAPPQRKE